MNTQRAKHLAAFGAMADAAARTQIGAQAADVFAGKRDAARAQGLQAGNGAQKRGLARAVGAYQRNRLACMDLQRNTLERKDLSITALQARDSQQGFAGLQLRCGGRAHTLVPR